jgi:hypothetical protein
MDNRRAWGLGAMVCACGLAVPATAQTKDRLGGMPAVREQLPVALGSVQVMRVSPHGRVGGGGGGGGSTDACNVIASHTDANFAGGTYNAQGGFSQGEIAATTYTVAASEFPIRINMTEVIVATSNATVGTTTHWSMMFWSGSPSAGTLVASFSSDGDILPHIVMGPGTNGVNVQFMVDPGDPEQIIIPNSGSNTFTIGFRIDQHNQQTQNPCTTAPPSCCNAFPVTDLSGVSAPAGNWLSGVNCGPLGCPPNGGWAAFSTLGLCRPSGDWVMRATWSGVNCQPGVGACCLPSGACEQMSATNCAGAGGTYRGDGVDCSGANCPVPSGACCFSNGNCLNLTEANCAQAAGTWLGAGTQCSAGQCPTGACCLPSGACVAGVTQPQCLAQSGVFRGAGTGCAGANCPQPGGACCLPSNGCLVLTQADCGQIPNSSWAGAFTTCPGGCTACYANCDGSTTQPILNVNDFVCFQGKYAAGDPAANCDNSTTQPILNVNDFICFQGKYAAGCP